MKHMKRMSQTASRSIRVGGLHLPGVQLSQVEAEKQPGRAGPPQAELLQGVEELRIHLAARGR